MGKNLKSLVISFFVVATLFTVITALIISYGFANNFNNQLKNQNNTTTEEPYVEALSDQVTLGETEDMGNEYIDKIIFLGESTTYGLQRYGVLKDGVNTNQVWTGATLKNGKIASAGTLSLSPDILNAKIFYPDTGEALTISQAIYKKSPEVLIITLGLNNGASYYSENEFKSCFRLLLNLISETDTKVILQSIFPTSKDCIIKAYTPERIKLCNSWVYDVAKEYGVNFLNTFEALSDENGYLKPEFDNGGDGIHLNAAGLNEVIKYIKNHGVRL
jgi:lysophospholipase L1-like esterase